MFRSITFVLSIWFLSGCSEPLSDSLATCRSEIWAQSSTELAYACIIRFDNQILLRKTDGKYGLLHHNGSDICAAHQGLFEATGWNARLISIGQLIPSNTQLISCSLDNVIDANRFPRQTPTGDDLILIDPFTLTHKDFHQPDDLIGIKNTFLHTPSSKSLHIAPN
jgi:hypothetical protein